MPINIEIKVVQFGQIRLEIGKPVSLVEETASRGSEVRYDEELTSYVVPQTTG